MTDTGTLSQCQHCHRPLPRPGRRGRPRRFCSPTCRSAARRARKTAQDASKPFAVTLRAAISASRLPLREIEHRLDSFHAFLGAATLSDWQNGHSEPADTSDSRNRVLALERVLGVPTGELIIRLEDSRRRRAEGPATARRPASPARPLTQLAGSPPTGGTDLARRHAALQARVNTLTGRQLVLPVTVAKEHLIRPDRRPMRSTVVHRVRAAHDDVDRFWFVHAFNNWVDVQVYQRRGCHLGRTLIDATPVGTSSGGVVLAAVELLFDAVLERGQLHEFSFGVLYRYDAAEPRLPERVFRHVQSQPCERVELRLRFASGTLPARIWQRQWRLASLAEEVGPPVATQLDGDQSVQITLVDAPATAVGWTWDWPAEDEAIPT